MLNDYCKTCEALRALERDLKYGIVWQEAEMSRNEAALNCRAALEDILAWIAAAS